MEADGDSKAKKGGRADAGSSFGSERGGSNLQLAAYNYAVEEGEGLSGRGGLKEAR